MGASWAAWAATAWAAPVDEKAPAALLPGAPSPGEPLAEEEVVEAGGEAREAVASTEGADALCPPVSACGGAAVRDTVENSKEASLPARRPEPALAPRHPAPDAASKLADAAWAAAGSSCDTRSSKGVGPPAAVLANSLRPSSSPISLPSALLITTSGPSSAHPAKKSARPPPRGLEPETSSHPAAPSCSATVSSLLASPWELMRRMRPDRLCTDAYRVLHPISGESPLIIPKEPRPYPGARESPAVAAATAAGPM